VYIETHVPEGNPPVRLGGHMTISHDWYRARNAAVRGEQVITSVGTEKKNHWC